MTENPFKECILASCFTPTTCLSLLAISNLALRVHPQLAHRAIPRVYIPHRIGAFVITLLSQKRQAFYPAHKLYLPTLPRHSTAIHSS